MRVQQVLPPDGGPESWTVLDERFAVVEPVDAFLSHLTAIERSPGTVRAYAFDLRDYFEFLAAHEINWRTVRLEHLGRFVGWLRLPPTMRTPSVTSLPTIEARCSAPTINRKLAAVGSFYKFHHRHGVDCGELLSTMKAGGVRGSWRPFLAHLGSAGDQRRRTIKLKTHRRLPRALSEESVQLIVDACDRLRDRFLIELLAATGMRIGEALGLRHEDIDAASTLIRIRTRRNVNGARVKSGQRDVPVPPSLIRLYTDYLVEEYGDLDCDYVFVNLWGGSVGTPWRYWNVTDLVARLRERSGVAFSAHGFRHTYATGLLRRGVPAEVVQRLLGHASVTTTTETYQHLEIEDIRRVLDRGWMPGRPWCDEGGEGHWRPGMSTQASLLQTTAPPGTGGQDGSWVDRLQELVAPVLIEDRIVVEPDDPVGGGAPCQIAGCSRPAVTGGLCSSHVQRWAKAGRPPLSDWDPGELPGLQWLSLAALPTPLRWEIAYGILQARQTNDVVRQDFTFARKMVRGLAESGITSLLEHPEHEWPVIRADRNHGQTSMHLRTGFLTFAIDELDKLRGAHSREHEFARDRWRLRRLGFTGDEAGWTLNFCGIEQPWLREAIKKFLRWRVDIGHSASGMHRDAATLTQLARALTDCAGPDARPEHLTRDVISRFLTVLAEDGLTATGRSQRISSAKRFLVVARRHDWIHDVPAGTAFYPEDGPARAKLAPRALSSVVMAQVESAANLDELTDRRWRLLFPLLMQTGLRINDALHLPQDCVVHDRHQAPYLRYHNRKMKREALVPISVEMAAMIAQQAQQVRNEYSPRAVLFPRLTRNSDGMHPVAKSVADQALKTWIADCRVVDESGASARVTLHQFRHTLGTRLINNDVPQEVVGKILDHDSSAMTAHYARLHDDTVRRHWERARKVDIHGNSVTFDEDSPLADAQWAKQHLSRATQALPNGYCGLPLQQSCPHANAPLTELTGQTAWRDAA